MAILIGQEAEGGSASAIAAVEIGEAVRFEVLLDGTVEELHVKFSAAFKGTKVQMAVVADEAGPKPKKESALAEGVKEVSGEPTEVAVTGLSLPVKKGEFVWLVFQPLGKEAKYKPGSPSLFSKSSTKKATIAAMAWNATTETGPISIWATGPETGGITQVAGTTKVKLKDAAAAAAAVTAGGTVKIKIKDLAAVLAAVEAAGATQVRFQNKALVSEAGITPVLATTKVRFKDTVTVTVTHEAGTGKKIVWIFED